MIILIVHNALILQRGYKLKYRKFISNFAATVLLLVTLLSITPKTLLHHLFAQHTDQESCNDNVVKGPCIHQQGFNCQQSDIVVPVSYLQSDVIAVNHPQFHFYKPQSFYGRSILIAFSASYYRRGPPNIHV